MKIFTLVSLFFVGLFSSAFAVAADPYQDGPNCYNTSLSALGYVENAVYSSEEELSFFVNNFCQAIDKTPQTMSAGRLILFLDPEDNSVVHTAVSLGQGQIIEKLSLLGTLNKAQEADPQPGQKIIHPLSESIYTEAKSRLIFDRTYPQKIYSCEVAEKVQAALKPLFKNPLIQEQLAFRKILSASLATQDRKLLEQNIMNHFVPTVLSMNWNKKNQETLQSPLEKTFFHALSRSNAYQFRLLICSESLKMGDDCHAPQIQKAVDVNNAWFTQIWSQKQ